MHECYVTVLFASRLCSSFPLKLGRSGRDIDKDKILPGSLQKNQRA
ncbi:hypothetical protein JI435_406810 [Parastagonospora nodorum SN15]|uniref:Uncharacterized protein n=1 Tax=Phaeosphaeria nodorum (strain SN15 / ATCC MYA-4574 / FGSC 10173) TaxID=321614 RepID=A0A7U2HX14_PHANO|nr:hypothetical protein JI435_406810 [Parastagonospora nodorum SN15]